MKRSGIIISFAALTFLVACGQKGPLYFAPEKVPEQKTERQAKPKPAETSADSENVAPTTQGESPDDSE